MIYLTVILAGGQSKRMGQDKAELIWQGKPLWQHQYDIAQKCGNNNIFVARNQTGFLQDNPDYLYYGPLAGFEAGLQKLAEIHGDYLLVLPVDMPLVTPKILQKLIESARNQPDNKEVILYKGQVFPLLIHISVSDKLTEYLKHKRSVQGFIAMLSKLEIEAEPDDDFRNTNTLTEWNAAKNKGENMFSLIQIHQAHSKVKSGADFPSYIAELQNLGVTYYHSYVKDGHAEYFSNNNFSVEDSALYDDLEINPLASVEKLQYALKIHQAGQTDYFTFCRHAADAGVDYWITDIKNMHVIYMDSDGNDMIIENIPI